MNAFKYFLVLFALLTAMCGKSDPTETDPEEPVSKVFSVNPTSITFTGIGWNYETITITAGKTDLQVMMENVDWLSVIGLKSSIPANTTATVKVVPTSTTDENRLHKIYVTEKNSGKTITVTIVQKAASMVKGFRLATYNFWIPNGRNNAGGSYKWANSSTALVKSIAHHKFDIIGFQEVDNDIMRKQLPSMVKEAGVNYEWWFYGRDASDGSKGECIGIAYNPDKFSISDKNHFWLSETPDKISTGWDETNYHRMAISAVVTEKSSSRQFFMMVTHGPLGAEASKNCAPIYIDREKMYNKNGLPSILVGDMNASSVDPLDETLRTYWKDVYSTIPAEYRSGTIGTFHSHGTHPEYLQRESRRIDHIYFRGDSSKFKIQSYCADDSQFAGADNAMIYPSDHCPVYIDVILK